MLILFPTIILFSSNSCDIFNTACEVEDFSTLGNLSGCYDDWDEDECDEISNTNFHKGVSCNDLGFTKQCYGPEYQDVWVLESYPCD